MMTEHLDVQYDKVVRMALQVVATLSSSKGSTSPGNSDPPPKPEGKGKESSATPARGKQLVKHQPSQSQPPLNKYFHMFIVELLKLFDSNGTLLESKGSFIIRSAMSS